MPTPFQCRARLPEALTETTISSDVSQRKFCTRVQPMCMNPDRLSEVVDRATVYFPSLIFQDWISMIKPMCLPQMARAPKVAKLREVRSLTLTISEAHRLPFKLVPNPYCIISLNQVKEEQGIC